MTFRSLKTRTRIGAALGALIILAAAATAAPVDEITAAVEFSLLDLDFRTAGGMDVPFLGGLPHEMIPGTPALPYRDVNVLLPAGAAAHRVRVDGAEWHPLQGTFDISPVTDPKTISHARPGEAGDPVFAKSDAVYGADRYYPAETATLLEGCDLAGQRMARVRVRPVRFNPVTGELAVASKVTFTVECVADDKAIRGCNLSEPGRRTVAARLAASAVNPGAVALPAYEAEGGLDLPTGRYDHVILAPASLAPAWRDLAGWHMKAGLRDTVVTLEWVYDTYEGGRTDQIAAFVEEAHEHWGMLWLLLGGDTGHIPYKMYRYLNENVCSDAYCSDLDGDWLNEVFVGRASVENEDDIARFTSRTLGYIKDPPVEDFGPTVFLGAFDFDSATHTEEMAEDIDLLYIPDRYDVWKVYDSMWNDHLAESLAALESGPCLVNLSDHAGPTAHGVGSVNHGWHLYNEDFLALGNGDRAGTAYSPGCFSNAIQVNDSFGEAWTHNPDGAGIAYNGNTHYGWYNPGYTTTLSCLFNRLWWRSLLDPAENRYRAGEALARSKDLYYPSDDYSKFIWLELTLNGDPALPLWTDDPAPLEAACAAAVPEGPQCYTVRVSDGEGAAVPDAHVCLMQGHGMQVSGFTSANGSAWLPAAPEAGAMSVTVTAQNRIPFETEVSVAGEADVSIAAVPESGSVVKPGELRYTATAANEGNVPVGYHGWTELTLPNGDPYPGNPVDGPAAATLVPGQAYSLQRVLDVPAHAPEGTYTCEVKLGVYPSFVAASASFEVEVTSD